MTPVVWLGLAVLLVVVAVLTGTTPKGGKPVARTQLVKTARVMLIVAVIVFGAIGLFGTIRP